jgi:hypothetical protein
VDEYQKIQRRLNRWRVKPGKHSRPCARFLESIRALPANLNEIGFAFVARDANEILFEPNDLAELETQQAYVRHQVELFDQRRIDERNALLAIFFGGFADVIEETWRCLTSYSWGLVPPFRAPQNPGATIGGRWLWLSQMLELAKDFSYETFNSEWFIQYGGHLVDYSVATAVATEMNRGGSRGENLFRLLCEKERKLGNEDILDWQFVREALLSSNRKDGWQLVLNKFKTAIPTYDHRLMILQFAGRGDPLVLPELVRLLLADRELFTDWLVSCRMQGLIEVPDDVPSGLSQWLAYLDESHQRLSAIEKSRNPRQVHLALQAEGWTDVMHSLTICESLLNNSDAAIRCVAARHACRIDLPEAIRLRRELVGVWKKA